MREMNCALSSQAFRASQGLWSDFSKQTHQERTELYLLRIFISLKYKIENETAHFHAGSKNQPHTALPRGYTHYKITK